MIPGSSNPLLLASAAEAAADTKSLRFNSGDSAYLNRTPSSAGNRKTWTWSGWVKRSALGSGQALFEASPGGSSYTLVWFNSSDKLGIAEDQGGGGLYFPYTAAVFRDTSAWYHIVVAVDTTQATSTNRIKIYVNGVQQTIDNSYPSQNLDTYVNSTNAHRIGYRVGNSAALSGYLADVHFIDGQALDPTDFGEFDATTGVWNPIEYTGSYGTNGFRLDFADATSTTTIAEDSSGNGNDWTANNISVTAGAGNDSLFDSPTNGTQSGNYATLNPLIEYTRAALTNGNLDANQASSSTAYAQGTIVPSSGKWFFEATCTAALISGTTSMRVGVAKVGSVASSSIAIYNGGDGRYEIFGSNTSGKATYTNGDVVGIALDIDAGTIQFYKNGSSQGSTSITAGVAYIPHVQLYAASCVFNFGQRAFAYTAPSGYKALCTANLPDPTIADPSDYMDVALYTGTGSTQSITGLNFSPDMVWLKARGGTYGTYYHRITDIVRGAAKELYTNETLSETNSPNGLNAFNSDGWTLGTEVGVNGSSTTYVGWAWDGGTAFSNSAGTNGASIASSGYANTSAGFSIVSYTGNDFTQTIAHGLNAAPSLIICKVLNNANDWGVYHESIGNTHSLRLNRTDQAYSATVYWNNTSPTSSVFTVGGSGITGASYNYIAYCWAPVEGYSAFGSYTGNGSTNGPFVYTGHRSRWLMIKRTDTSSQWSIWDTARNTYNAAGTNLWADSSEVEATSVNYEADFLSNGFKMRNSHAARNASGGTYIYMSFAEHPFKTSRAR